MNNFSCVCCNDWEWKYGEFEDYDTCPNCDFPVKFTDWIVNMQTEIADLKYENERLYKKINGVFND